MNTKTALVTQQNSDGVYIAQFKTTDLSIFSYYVESQNQSYLIDPTFDFHIFQKFIQSRNSQLKYVLLTHYHADFLAGHTQFGVPILMGQKSKRSINSFEVLQIQDGNSFTIGNVSTKVLHTPGHTLESSCFLLSNSNLEQVCLFSGDTVFLGQVGRPDLAVSSTTTRQDLAGMLYDSIQKIKLLDHNLRLYPGHGAGSACGKSIGSGNFCNLQNQHTKNYGFLVKSKQEFVKAVTQGIQQPPKYFFYDAKLNQLGPQNDYQTALNKSKKKLSIQEFEEVFFKNAIIIDTRQNVQSGMIKNSYWLNQKGPISNWVAMLLPPQAQFFIVCQNGVEENIIQRFLRIGYFGCQGFNGFEMSQWKEEKSYPVTKTFNQLPQSKTFLDVRTKGQWNNTGVIEGATMIELKDLQKSDEALQTLKRRAQNLHIQNIVVHCKIGLRARLALSILLRKNITNAIVLLQDTNNFSNLGLNIISLQKNELILKERLAKDYFYEGMKSFNSGNVQESRQKFNKCVQNNSNIAEPYINLAICNLKNGNSQQALKNFKTAVKIDPFNYISYFDIFSMKCQANKIQESLKYLYASLSCLYLDRAKQLKSINDIQMALQYAPNNFQALVLKSLNQKVAKNDEQAFDLLKKAYIICPNNQNVKNLLNKFCQFTHKKYPQAVQKQFIGLQGKQFQGTNIKLQIQLKLKQLNKIYMHDHKPLNKDKSLVVDFERSFTGVNRIYKVRR